MTKKAIINYTARDFTTIKNELVEHAKRYYPERYNDFNESSFGSMMMDSVAYVGDVLSFYLDFQINESYIETALEPNTIRNLASQMGYKFFGSPRSFGVVTLYLVVPANSTGLGPNEQFLPVIKAGTKFKATSGNVFILAEDVNFGSPNVSFVAARRDENTNKPTSFALRSFGRVMSGDYIRLVIPVGEASKFKRVRVGPSIINDIVEVRDSDGNIYHKVDYLTQDTVYKETTNFNYINDGVPSIIKPIVATRRYVLEQDATGTYLRFGYGSDDDTDATVDVSDPKSIIMKFAGRDYFTDSAFDPNKFLNTDKFGICPANTNLIVRALSNTTADANEAVGSINEVINLNMSFANDAAVGPLVRGTIGASLEVSNESAIIVSSNTETSDEIRYRAMANYSAQHRVVTKNDYEAYCYQMPPRFGSIKRACIVNDPSYTNRRLSLYVVSETTTGNLTSTNIVIKNNLKIWLEKNKMISDAIDIIDAKIINVGFDYPIAIDSSFERTAVLSAVNQKLEREFAEKFYIGEPLYITKIYNSINKVEGVIDTVKVTPKILSGGLYSPVNLGIMDIKSKDGTYLKTPKNAILEIKFLTEDIRGTIV